MCAQRGKTLKLVSKRLNIKKGGKVFRRTAGQGHNKAKMPGHVTRLKRIRQEVSGHPGIQRAIKRMYHSKA